MKPKLNRAVYLCLLGLSLLPLIGCATEQPLVLTQPVGPVEGEPKHFQKHGELIVYSAWDRFDTLDSAHWKHTAYSLRPENGGKVIRVRNRCGTFGQDAEVVALPPGSYLLDVYATNAGLVKVPVVVREGLTTEVYLDGISGPPKYAQAERTNWISQPNGQVLGWRDSSAAK